MKISSTQCPRCLKTEKLCMCAEIRPQETRIHVLILQHPQEPDQDLGSARIAHLALPNSTLKIGLSWPNLKSALGREVIASRWAVLYLGSGEKGRAEEKTERPKSPRIRFVDKKGVGISVPISPFEIDGIIAIDGTWSQAKAIWWRNPWLLKCKRAILTPAEKSLYGELRREPRRECLSTIESIADAFEALKEKPETSKELKALFSRLLDKKRKPRSA